MQTGSAPVPTADGLPSDARFAIVVARFNESITSKLLAGAINAFAAVGISEDRVRTAWVPGAWELPLVAKRFAHSGQFAAVLCLGAVIKGENDPRSVHQPSGERQFGENLPGNGRAGTVWRAHLRHLAAGD